MFTFIKSLYIFYKFHFNNHICTPFTKAYMGYMYMNMYISIYYNHICIPLFKGLI